MTFLSLNGDISHVIASYSNSGYRFYTVANVKLNAVSLYKDGKANFKNIFFYKCSLKSFVLTWYILKENAHYY